MEKKFYKEDFKLRLDIADRAGMHIGVPGYDWEARVFTVSPRAAVVASCRDGVLTNARIADDGSGIILLCDRHALMCGRVMVEFHGRIPDADYADGFYDFTRLWKTELWLVAEPMVIKPDDDVVVKIEALMPYIKGERGDAFTYDDFTAEEIAELQRPSTEAAERADALAGTLAANELIRVKAESERELAETRREEAENLRGENESLRKGSEVLRDKSEIARKAAELGRETAETARVEAEVARQMAESAREEEFAAYGKVLDDKVGKAELAESLLSKQDKLTVSEDLALSDNKLSLADIAKMRLFCDMFNAAAGTYGYARIVDGEFDCELNGLKLTYEEAMEIYSSCISLCGRTAAYTMYNALMSNKKIRTTMPLCSTVDYTWQSAFHGCTNLEIIQVRPMTICTGATNAFNGCTKLREIRGPFNMFNLKLIVGGFVGCESLEYIEFVHLNQNISFAPCPKITVDCVRYWINKRLNTNTFTITVHADVYAKLTGDTSNEAAAALSAEELAAWQKVCTDAAAKNISFASA